MKKDLPYFKWYPADALSDIDYASLDLPELGLFHACLNYSWVNDGLPADPLAIAKLLRIEKQRFMKIWSKIEREFPVGVGDRRRNFRQETERQGAYQKSAKASESVKVRYERTTNDLLRARARADCVSVSDSSLQGGAGGIPPKLPAPRRVFDGEAFRRWLAPWPRVAKPDAAAQAWLSVVDGPETEAAAFAARDRYLASDEVARNIITNPDKFLFDQADCGWAGKWPAAVNGKTKKPTSAGSADYIPGMGYNR